MGAFACQLFWSHVGGRSFSTLPGRVRWRRCNTPIRGWRRCGATSSESPAGPAVGWASARAVPVKRNWKPTVGLCESGVSDLRDDIEKIQDRKTRLVDSGTLHSISRFASSVTPTPGRARCSIR